MTISRRQTLLTAIAAAASLNGCAAIDLVATRTPPKLFELTPKTTFDEMPKLDKVIIVEPATAAAGLNTARIALRPEPTLLEYYAGALWVDVVPVMVQTLVVETLDSTNSVQAMSPSEAAGTRPDYLMRLNIREFQAEYLNGTSAPPQVDIRIQCRLLGLPRRLEISQLDEAEQVEAAGTSVEQVVRAYDDALGKVLKRLGKWAVATIDKAKDA